MLMWVGHLRENSSMYKRAPSSRDYSTVDDVEENLGMHPLFKMEYVFPFFFFYLSGIY